MNITYVSDKKNKPTINKNAGERKLHKTMYRFFLVAILFYCIVIPVGAEDRKPENDDRKKPDIQQVVQAVDQLYRHDTSHTLMNMTIKTPHWERTLRIESWSEGMDNILLRILEPTKERGLGTLRIGNEMWNYLPKTNKVMKIPPSMMMSSWMGSDFKNNDLVKEFTFIDDYTFSYISKTEAAVGKEIQADADDLLYLKCIPKPGKPIIWGHVVLVVDAGNFIPKMEQYYDEDGKLMRTMRFSEITNFGGTRLPAVMELKPETKQGRRTTIRYIEAEFNIPLSDDIFSLRNLRTFHR